MIQIFHNPRCSKSRECVLKFDTAGKDYQIINYLQHPPTVKELKSLLKKLNISPIQLVRKKEPVWVTNYKGKQLTDAEVIQALADNPILIERPIVVNGDRAVIARPASNADAII